jgi:hypothetical protein
VAVLVVEAARLFLALPVSLAGDEEVQDSDDHEDAAGDGDDAPDGLDHAVPPAGIEPASRGLKARRSNH